MSRDSIVLQRDPLCFRRPNVGLVCHPCSDIEDRDHPVYVVRAVERCAICREYIDD